MSTYTPIESITLTSATPKVTFSSIPQNYTDIIMVGVITNSASQIYGAIQFNTDNVGSSSTKYSVTSLANWQNNPYSDRQTNTYGIASWEKTVSGTDDTAVITITVNDYSNTAKYKTAMARVAGTHVNLSGNNIGVWRSYEAVNSISFDTANGNNFGIGCTFTLYGVQSGNSSAKATGGNIVTTDGSYWYHTFISSGTFIPSQALTADVLVVAGGGGTGVNFSAGAGAGGLLAFTSQSLASSTVYPCLVGAGGVGSATGGGGNGINSQFGSLTAAVGGGTGMWGGNNKAGGSTGGSGGGATDTITSGFAGTSGQGNAGGGGSGSVNGGTGGGGGAGAAGNQGSFSNSGSGGAGVNTYSSWASATGTGVSGYYAGGGGGGAYGGNQSGAGGGGAGGGGAGGLDVKGVNGTPNTGGGAGGAGAYQASGSNGGSGIIIVRYAV